jgi:DeoR family transcriptional regulator, aga operon transcriptional repressor
MSSELRQEKLIALLEVSRELDIPTLTRELGASEATVRRDLSLLEGRGIIIRTIGGARLKDKQSLVVRTFDERVQRHRREKESIASKAAGLVKPGMVVAVDSGTTGWLVASFLKATRPLTVITSALGVIEELGAIDGIDLVCLGGQFRKENLDFIGENVTRQFGSVHVDMAFLGGDSLMLPGKGMYANDYLTSLVSRAIGSCCDRCVVVMDHSKLNVQGTFLAIPCRDIHLVITDSGTGEDARRLLRGEPFDVMFA